jgi:hypothetical protein
MGDFPGHPFRGNQWTDVAGGASGAIGPVTLTAYRVGAIDPSSKRGVFFGDSPESVAGYAAVHKGQAVQEYTVTAQSAYVTDSQHSLFKELYPDAPLDRRTFNEAVYKEDRALARKDGGFGNSVLASRRVEEKMARVLRGRGHDAIIYKSPPLPSKHEIALLKGSGWSLTPGWTPPRKVD